MQVADIQWSTDPKSLSLQVRREGKGGRRHHRGHTGSKTGLTVISLHQAFPALKHLLHDRLRMLLDQPQFFFHELREFFFRLHRTQKHPALSSLWSGSVCGAGGGRIPRSQVSLLDMGCDRVQDPKTSNAGEEKFHSFPEPTVGRIVGILILTSRGGGNEVPSPGRSESPGGGGVG